MDTFCDACQGEGRSTMRVPGILIAISTKPSTWSLGVERCDACERFESDEAAFRFVCGVINTCWPQAEGDPDEDSAERDERLRMTRKLGGQ